VLRQGEKHNDFVYLSGKRKGKKGCRPPGKKNHGGGGGLTFEEATLHRLKGSCGRRNGSFHDILLGEKKVKERRITSSLAMQKGKRWGTKLKEWSVTSCWMARRGKKGGQSIYCESSQSEKGGDPSLNKGIQDNAKKKKKMTAFQKEKEEGPAAALAWFVRNAKEKKNPRARTQIEGESNSYL